MCRSQGGLEHLLGKRANVDEYISTKQSVTVSSYQQAKLGQIAVCVLV